MEIVMRSYDYDRLFRAARAIADQNTCGHNSVFVYYCKLGKLYWKLPREGG